MADEKRIEQVFDRITAETLDMGSWAAAKEDPNVNASCGTTMCFAGHAAVAAGKTLKWEPKTDYVRDASDNIVRDPVTGTYERKVIGWHAQYTTDGDEIEEFAAVWLDLDENEAEAIFYATGIRNDVEKLRHHVDAVIRGEYWHDYEEDDDF